MFLQPRSQMDQDTLRPPQGTGWLPGIQLLQINMLGSAANTLLMVASIGIQNISEAFLAALGIVPSRFNLKARLLVPKIKANDFTKWIWRYHLPPNWATTRKWRCEVSVPRVPAEWRIVPEFGIWGAGGNWSLSWCLVPGGTSWKHPWIPYPTATPIARSHKIWDGSLVVVVVDLSWKAKTYHYWGTQHLGTHDAVRTAGAVSHLRNPLQSSGQQQAKEARTIVCKACPTSWIENVPRFFPEYERIQHLIVDGARFLFWGPNGGGGSGSGSDACSCGDGRSDGACCGRCHRILKKESQIAQINSGMPAWEPWLENVSPQYSTVVFMGCPVILEKETMGSDEWCWDEQGPCDKTDALYWDDTGNW